MRLYRISKLAELLTTKGGNNMEKINITHFYFMDEGKRIEETVEAIDLGNDCVLTMTGIYSIYDGPRGPEIGYHSEISENVMCSTPKTDAFRG